MNFKKILTHTTLFFNYFNNKILLTYRLSTFKDNYRFMFDSFNMI